MYLDCLKILPLQIPFPTMNFNVSGNIDKNLQKKERNGLPTVLLVIRRSSVSVSIISFSSQSFSHQSSLIHSKLIMPRTKFILHLSCVVDTICVYEEQALRISYFFLRRHKHFKNNISYFVKFPSGGGRLSPLSIQPSAAFSALKYKQSIKTLSDGVGVVSGTGGSRSDSLILKAVPSL